MQLSQKAMLEVSELTSLAGRLARGNPGERAQSAVLLAKIKNIREFGISSYEMRARYADALLEELNPGKGTEARYQKAFENYIRHGQDSLSSVEQRDLMAGTSTITWTQLAAGGAFLPISYSKVLFEALAATDEVLDPDVSSFTVEDGPSLPPQQLSGFDLSTVEAVQISEGQQQTGGTFPTVNGRVLRGNIIYKATFAVSLEAGGVLGEGEDVPGVLQKVSRAMGISYARRLGADVIGGNGASAPQGILTAVASSYTTSSGKITNSDINSIVYSINRAYRISEKCGWLMDSTVLERIRESVDSSAFSNRPLLDVIEGENVLAGFPIHICPSLGAMNQSLGLNSSVVFGDLSHVVTRCSKPTLIRALQSANTIEYGKVLLIGKIRMDSCVFDPSSGSAPPLAVATITV